MNQTYPFKNVTVLAGGIGEEREVSLQSGQNIYQSLKQTDLNVILSDITTDDMSALDNPETDIFFLALHGRFGEDGQLQKILEDKGLTYTGSDLTASRLAFDKKVAKEKFIEAGILTPQAVYVKENQDWQTLEVQLATLGDKLVVKPITQGSSVGIEIVNSIEKAVETAKTCFSSYGDCMIEQFIAGREFTVGIVENTALPLIEIRPKTEFYDYFAKYQDDATEFLFDTLNSEFLIEKIQLAGLQCYQALGCRHLSRVDFILTESDEFYALEVNTLPGFTSHSLLPLAAQKAGMSAPELCVKILTAAWNDAH